MNVLVSFALLTQKTSSLLKEELSKFEEFSFETTDKCSEKLSLIERSFAIHRFMREVQYLPVNDVHVFVSVMGVTGACRWMGVIGVCQWMGVTGACRWMGVAGVCQWMGVTGACQWMGVAGACQWMGVAGGVSVGGSDRGVSVDGSDRGVSVDGSGRGCVRERV